MCYRRRDMLGDQLERVQLEQALSASTQERFLLDTTGVSATAAKKWLIDRSKLAEIEGEVPWPKKLDTLWKKQGYDDAFKAAIVQVPYCPNPKCQRRIKPAEQLASQQCVRCGAIWFNHLPSGGRTIMSYDFYVRPEWNIGLMLSLPEFSGTFALETGYCLHSRDGLRSIAHVPHAFSQTDALVDFWPRALELMERDPDDLTVPVDDVLSGTLARRLYRMQRENIKFDLVPGNFDIILVLTLF